MTKPSISYRCASREDAETILSFIRGLADFEQLAHECVITKQNLEETIFCDNPAASVILAEISGQAVGFALYFRTYSTFLGKPGMYLEDLFVLPEFRKMGVGTGLISQLAKIAVENNYGRLEWSVLDWNSNAISLYQSLGAKLMTDWTVNRVTGVDLINLASR